MAIVCRHTIVNVLIRTLVVVPWLLIARHFSSGLDQAVALGLLGYISFVLWTSLSLLRWTRMKLAAYEPLLPDSGEIKVGTDGNVTVNSDGADGGPVVVKPLRLWLAVDMWVMLLDGGWLFPLPVETLTEEERQACLLAVRVGGGAISIDRTEEPFGRASNPSP
jgi:hypothetical protein